MRKIHPALLLFTIYSSLVFGQGSLNPGDILPGAKILDADELFPFSDGVARIKKGVSYALIDSAGKFVVPFNQWVLPKDSKYSILIIQDIKTGKYGAISSKGKVLLPCIQDNDFLNIDNEGYMLVPGPKGRYYINAAGNKMNVPADAGFTQKWSEGLTIIKKNYVNRQGRVIIPTQFDVLKDFSEGLAVVGKHNEFGEMKYGFIDRQGKLVIPLKFSNEPGDFTSGLSLVKPVNTDEFNFAYINKKGEIALKITKTPGGYSFTSNESGFKYGLSEWTASDSKNYFIDTLGNIISRDDYLKDIGLDRTWLWQWIGFRWEQYGYLALSGNGRGPGSKGVYSDVGILDIKNKKFLPFLYHFPNITQIPYDPVSGLILTSTTKEIDGKKEVITGYINTNGVYVMIKGEKAKW